MDSMHSDEICVQIKLNVAQCLEVSLVKDEGNSLLMDEIKKTLEISRVIRINPEDEARKN